MTSRTLATTLLPAVPGLRLDAIEIGPDQIRASLIATRPRSACPACGCLAQQIHSRYQRTLTDLPWGGCTVRLQLSVRKFFCREPHCSRRIFTERLPAIVVPYARRTTRLAEVLRLVAFALGGEAGARLVARLGMAVSPATLLRLIRRTSLVEHATPRTLGVDDWALRKGHRYGTILVDLDQHEPIDVLPDRQATTLAQWLQEHPGVEIVARDRSDAYAAGIRQGAPTALQVADRFHLCHNLGEALERFFNRQRALLRGVERPWRRAEVPDPAGAPAPTLPAALRRAEELKREQRRAARQAQYDLIRERALQGASIAQIARDLQLNWKTVRKYAEADVCPEPQPYPPRPRMLSPYEAYLRQRWAEGCHNGAQLYREVAAQGFGGSHILVAIFVAQLRRQDAAGTTVQAPAAEPRPPSVTPREAASLVLRRPADRSTAEQTTVEQLGQLSPELGQMLAFSDRFLRLLRDRQGGPACDAWLAEAVASDIPELRRFAIKLRQDEAAVRAACTERWSNGQTEGQITKLKLLKRSMYGRAKFDLLRSRVLAA